VGPIEVSCDGLPRKNRGRKERGKYGAADDAADCGIERMVIHDFLQNFDMR
jgi:hypothetical protein